MNTNKMIRDKLANEDLKAENEYYDTDAYAAEATAEYLNDKKEAAKIIKGPFKAFTDESNKLVIKPMFGRYIKLDNTDAIEDIFGHVYYIKNRNTLKEDLATQLFELYNLRLTDKDSLKVDKDNIVLIKNFKKHIEDYFKTHKPIEEIAPWAKEMLGNINFGYTECISPYLHRCKLQIADHANILYESIIGGTTLDKLSKENLKQLLNEIKQYCVEEQSKYIKTNAIEFSKKDRKFDSKENKEADKTFVNSIRNKYSKIWNTEQKESNKVGDTITIISKNIVRYKDKVYIKCNIKVVDNSKIDTQYKLDINSIKSFKTIENDDKYYELEYILALIQKGIKNNSFRFDEYIYISIYDEAIIATNITLDKYGCTGYNFKNTNCYYREPNQFEMDEHKKMIGIATKAAISLYKLSKA